MRRLDYPYTNLRIAPSIRCNFACTYCTHFEYQKSLIEKRKPEVEPEVWIKHLSRLNPLRPLTVIFGTGEPTQYKGISKIINSLPQWKTLLYTNASNPTLKELRLIKPRDNFLVYVSYHPHHMKIDDFAENSKWIKKTFKVIDFHGVKFKKNEKVLAEAKTLLAKHDIDLNLEHPLVGWFDDKFYWYDNLVQEKRFADRFAGLTDLSKRKTVLCKVSANHIAGASMVYPIGPDGSIYACWRYMLNSSDEGILGNLFDEDFVFEDKFYECKNYGDCNICSWDNHIIDKETGRQLDIDTVDRVYV